MKKSTINLIYHLKEKLAEFPKIVDQLENKELSFMGNLLEWIKGTEQILTNHNINEVSLLAGYRSKIISSKFNQDISPSKKKKLQLHIASEVLFDLQNTVFTVLNPREIKVEESRELIRQLLQIVSQTKIIKYNSQLPYETLVSDIWSFIISNDQINAGASKLKTSLSTTDIFILFAEEINIEDF